MKIKNFLLSSKTPESSLSQFWSTDDLVPYATVIVSNHFLGDAKFMDWYKVLPSSVI